MNTSLMLPLEGPSISGVVEVPLAELDKMRVNHANAVRMVEEMKEKRQMVWVTVTNIDNGSTEKLTDWKNLDDIEKALKGHLEEQFDERLEKLNATVRGKDITIQNGNEELTMQKEQNELERIAWNEEDRQKRLELKELKTDKKLCLSLSRGKSNLLDKRHDQVMELLREKKFLLGALEKTEEALAEKKSHWFKHLIGQE